MKLTGRIAWLFAGVMSLLSLAGGMPAGDVEAQELSNLRAVSGKIVSVDLPRGTLMVEKEKGASPADTVEQTPVLINHDTAISKAGLRLTLADLQPSSDPVTIQYATQGDRMVARVITFERPADLAHASGTIERIDLLKGAVVVKPDGLLWGGSRKTFTLTERTVISQGGIRSYLANSKPGDEAFIDYTMEGDRPVIFAMTITTPPRHPSFEVPARSSETPRHAPGRSGSPSSKE